MGESQQSLDLDRIIFIGRTFEEYTAMFDLTNDEIQKRRVLDCPAGACSFTAEANRVGGDATAADIAYAYEAERLYTKGLEDLAYGARQVEKVQAAYSWSYFKTVDQLTQIRRSALEKHTADRKAQPSCYVAVTLPELPFQDRQFDMVLSAHFLFTYSNQLDRSFHQATVLELMRVTARELRIFPLVDLKGQQSPHLEAILQLIRDHEWNFEICSSNYEFQKNANQYLRIYR